MSHDEIGAMFLKIPIVIRILSYDYARIYNVVPRRNPTISISSKLIYSSASGGMGLHEKPSGPILSEAGTNSAA